MEKKLSNNRLLKDSLVPQDMELRNCKPTVENMELAKKMDQLVLDIHRLNQEFSQGSHTSQKQGDPKPVDNKLLDGRFKQLGDPKRDDDKIWSERIDLLKCTLEELKRGNLTNGVREDGLTPYQRIVKSANHYAQLEDRFTSLNLDHAKETHEDFKIRIECKQFKPNELKVTLKDGCIVVEGKHDARLDEHGLIQREFTRRWSFPEDVKQEKISCLLDQYGILTIRAPRKISKIVIPIQTEKSVVAKLRQ